MPRRLLSCLLPLVLVAGCTFPSAPEATSPTTTIPVDPQVSQQQGPSVDRPVYEDPQVEPEGYADAPEGAGLAGYLDQEISWQTCGGAECASILAPLDYAEPQGQAITLSLKRLAATEEPRLGTLFVNPGGPGASGKDLVDYFDATGLERYDILGWDPRGTADSTPVKCLSADETDAYLDLDSSPDDEQERSALLEGNRAFAEACWENSGDLLEHISTIETVRDLDLLRQLVGDDQLTFLGYSYGTQIGATYAELFPRKVGRLVLDAAVNITDSDEVIQAMGFDLALSNFAQWCAEESCSLGSSRDEVLSAIQQFWEGLDSDPIAVRSRTLTQTLAVIGVAAMLYSGEEAWPAIETYINAAQAGQGEGLLWAADQLNGRNESGSYDTSAYAFPAISCVDSTDEGVLAADEDWQNDQAKAPIFGTYFGPQYICAVWPTRPSLQLDITAEGASPIVVIGGTGDNATPYQQAVDMAEKLQSGVLVTYEGEGHGTYGGKSTCIDDLVVSYLVDGEVPRDGTSCS